MTSRSASAGAEDAARLNAALRALSDDLGDTYKATDDDILRAGFGKDPAFRAILALRQDAVGVIALSALYSTTRAAGPMSGPLVAEARACACIGPRLLAFVRDDIAARWGGFIRLAVYTDNSRAVDFYRRMGFSAQSGEVGMTEGAVTAAIGAPD